MKPVFLLFVYILFSPFAFSQDSDSLAIAVNKIHQALIKADNSDKDISQNDLSTLEKLYYQSQKQGYQIGIENCGTDFMRQHIRHGAFQKAIEVGRQIISSTKTYRISTTATEVHRMLGLAYGNLGLYEQSLQEYHLSIDAISMVKTKDFRHYLRAIAYENVTIYFEQTGQHLDSIEYYYKKSIQEAELISDTSSRLPSNYKFNAIMYAHRDLAGYYLTISKPPQPKKAEEEIEIALDMNEKEHGKVMLANKIAFLATLCQSFYFQDAYAKAISYGLQGLDLESNYPSPYDRVIIYETLAKSYLAKNDKEASGKYMNLYTALKDSLHISEKIQASTAVNRLLASETKNYGRKTRQIIWWALALVLTIVLIAYIIWKTNSKSLRKKYETLIRELREENQQEAMRTAAPQTEPLDTEAKQEISGESRTAAPAEETNTSPGTEKTSTTASDETLSKLLIRLEEFERSHKYLKPEISLTSLSHYIGTNQTYLSELLKVYRGTTYRNYINGLKINYIKKKLYEEPIYREYKIAHLAEECGFASRQVFISVFKKQTGVPPSYFISQLKNENSTPQAE